MYFGIRVFYFPQTTTYSPQHNVSSLLCFWTGSGKSTLLSAISGTTLKSSKLEALGSVWVDEKDAETGEKKAVSLSLG